MEIISHRGNYCGEQENTLPAITQAWKANVDAVEIDLRMSSDQVIFLFHNRRFKGKEVSLYSYAEITKRDDKIPTLISILSAGIPSGYYLFDLKEYSKEFMTALSKTVSNSEFPEEKIVFQSDNAELLVSLRTKHSKAKYIYLSKLKRSFPFFKKPDPIKLKQKLSEFKFDGISLKNKSYINQSFINVLKADHTDVYVWTINNVDRANEYSTFGVTGIITDDVKSLKNSP